MEAHKKNLFIKILILSSFFFQINLQSLENPHLYSSTQLDSYKPWFTGPLLTPTPVNMVPGHPVIEPSFQVVSTYGVYDENKRFNATSNMWTLKPLIDFQMGFTSRTGLEIVAAITSSYRKGGSATRPIDTFLRFGYQVSNDTKGTWIPDFRVILQETLPTGSYQKLNPKNYGTDLTGMGSFQTGIYLVYQKLFHITNGQRLSIRSSLAYLYPAPVHVKGYNAYGGGHKARAKVYPGNLFQAYFSVEYSLSKYWAIINEWILYQNAKNRFKGKPGFLPDGQLSEISTRSSHQLSTAIELEHTFSARFGMLLGSWFTVTGRNSRAFLSNFIVFLYVF